MESHYIQYFEVKLISIIFKAIRPSPKGVAMPCFFLSNCYLEVEKHNPREVAMDEKKVATLARGSNIDNPSNEVANEVY